MKSCKLKKLFQISVFVLALFCLAFLFVPNNLQIVKAAQDDESDETKYVIDAYDVNITVQENNVYIITETIKTNFIETRHGIQREIPTWQKVTRADGTSSKIHAIISNFSVKFDGETESFSKFVSLNYETFKIGSTNRTHQGEHIYEISYEYNFGQDSLTGKDEFYFNIIGLNWDTTIDNVTFKITMPKEFDESKLGFTWGGTGQNFTSDVSYVVNGKVISGNLGVRLGGGQAFTVRLELPEGYFVGASDNFQNKYFVPAIVVACVELLAVVLALVIYKTSNHEVVPVNFYAPDKFTSLDVGLFYNGKVKRRDATSMFVYLASKKYIKIEDLSKTVTTDEYVEENLLTNKTESKNVLFNFTKLKEYDGEDLYAKEFMDVLFADGDIVTSRQLADSNFGSSVEKIIKKKNKERPKVIEKKDSLISLLAFGISLLSLIPIILIFLEVSWPVAMLAVIIAGGILSLLVILPVYTVFSVEHRPKTIAIFVHLIFIVFFCFINLFIAWMNKLAFIIIPISVLTSMFGWIFRAECILRTKNGQKIYNDIAGFRNFLLKAEKPVLEKLVEENPSYFFDVLPYTYVLGISKKWISKLEFYGFTTEEKQFIFIISTSFEKSIKTATKTHPNWASGSSSGWSSGGGLSGGGGGGGGGSSW